MVEMASRQCWLKDHPIVEKIQKYSSRNQVPAIMCYFDLTEVKQLESVTVEHKPDLEMVVLNALRCSVESREASQSQAREQQKRDHQPTEPGHQQEKQSHHERRCRRTIHCV